MSGVYGDLLAFFHELIRAYDRFSASPKSVAGYETRVPKGQIKGIIQAMRGGDLPVQGELLTQTNVLTFWTRGTLDKEDYITRNGVVYKRTKDNDWQEAGRTNVYILESVSGTFDDNVKNTNVTFGKETYV